MTVANPAEYVITYSVSPGTPLKRPGLLRLTLRVEWRTGSDPPGDHFPGVVLMASQTRIPSSRSDGVELHRWAPASLIEPCSIEAWIDPVPARKQGWRDFFCKLLLMSAEGGQTLIIHPNTCQVLQADGRPGGQPRPPAPLRYEPGTPRTLVCPTCFEVFAVNRMLFAFDAKGPFVPAPRSPFDRFRRIRRIAIPVDGRGRRAVYRFCPNHHRLPSSAGTQSSLVVGLIGAKYSGKTHYIGSLVHGLRLRSGIDDDLAVHAADEQTDERFRRVFEERLFEDHRQLDATVGEPPPLIYDLSFPLADTVRRVTLALYDTAGENLQDPRKAEQMVRYVRVAAGLMLLVDPLQIDHVRDRVPEAELPGQDPAASANGILDSVLGPLYQHKVLPQNGPLPIPIAVVLTKCDVLRKHGLLGKERLWSFPNYRHIGCFRTRWHEDMSSMVGELLREWLPAAFAKIENKFPNHAYFGASSTGAAADAVGRFPSVKPYRVEDPLLWLLSELGVFPAEELK